MAAWEASIDRRLVARLVRPIERPGVIRTALARRILAGVAAMTDRLPLLGRFGGRRALAATTPIVHAQWQRGAPEAAAPPAVAAARPVVRPAGAAVDPEDRAVPASARAALPA